MKKQHIFISALILCSIAFIIPFLVRSCPCEESLFSVLALSFTAVGAVATVFTLIIAFLLYDRFGNDAKFIERKMDKVLELVDLLKGKCFYIKSLQGHVCHLRPSKSRIETIRKMKLYSNDRDKTILICIEDYEKYTDELLAIRRSYWLPEEINEKLEFLNIAMIIKVNNPDDDNFVKLYFDSKKVKEWSSTIPEITFGEFTDKLYDLVDTLENWVKKHSNINIDFKFEEQNQILPEEEE